jgi:hypothetical protein
VFAKDRIPNNNIVKKMLMSLNISIIILMNEENELKILKYEKNFSHRRNVTIAASPLRKTSGTRLEKLLNMSMIRNKMTMLELRISRKFHMNAGISKYLEP